MVHSPTMCAHRTLFGPLLPAALEVGDNLERMDVTRSVAYTLHDPLFPRLVPQLGVLFGQIWGDILTLAVAVRAG
jgi:hypothetical protein